MIEDSFLVRMKFRQANLIKKNHIKLIQDHFWSKFQEIFRVLQIEIKWSSQRTPASVSNLSLRQPAH